MPTTYNQVVGQNVECPAAPGDGGFAVAMTLLVPDPHAPAVEAIDGEQGCGLRCSNCGPRLPRFAWVSQFGDLSG